MVKKDLLLVIAAGIFSYVAGLGGSGEIKGLNFGTYIISNAENFIKVMVK